MPAGQVWRSYYSAGSQRVALREVTISSEVVYYFVADRLGSTSITLCGSSNGCNGVAYGGKVGEMRYLPFGETRYTWGGTPTDRHFTGQREENGLGSLYDYNARFYSPVLGRFLSADTMVPGTANPQAWNRYSYGLNNPLKYIDPTGHYICTVDTNLNSTQCRSWVEQTLSALASAGTTGSDLVKFFRNLDKAEGINIHFQDLINGVLLSPPVGNTIVLPDFFLGTKSSSNTALFGHEISHLGQSAGERLSMRGEAAAFQTEHKLRNELAAKQTPYTEAAWGKNRNPYDLTQYGDLMAATWGIRNVPESPYTWQPFYAPDDFSENTNRIREIDRWAFLSFASQRSQRMVLDLYGPFSPAMEYAARVFLGWNPR